jgi:hypothetical protein
VDALRSLIQLERGSDCRPPAEVDALRSLIQLVDEIATTRRLKIKDGRTGDILHWYACARRRRPHRSRPLPGRATAALAPTKRGAVVEAMSARMDVVASWTRADPETRDAGANADPGLAQVEADRPS